MCGPHPPAAGAALQVFKPLYFWDNQVRAVDPFMGRLRLMEKPDRVLLFPIKTPKPYTLSNPKTQFLVCVVPYRIAVHVMALQRSWRLNRSGAGAGGPRGERLPAASL